MGMPGEKYLGGSGPLDEALGKIIAPRILDLFLCESRRLVLRPNQLYYFRVDPACEECKRIEAEGAP